MKEFSEMIIAEQAPIGDALERVIQKLPKPVQEIASYSLLSGGKRLRPMLSLLSARLFFPEISIQNPKIYDAAIVLEMFHVASLLHDDVLDNADTRRGQTSVHIKYGIRPCLLAGDALLAAGNRQMADFALELNCPQLIHSISDALLHTSTGEIEEIALVGKILPSMDDYFSVIEGKTAWILRSACEVGALLANALGNTASSFADKASNNTLNKGSSDISNRSVNVSDEEIKRLATFGLNLGMAFQIVDDALDFAPEAITGKPCGGDLRERKCTPPIFMYAQSLDAKARKEFEEKFAIVPMPIFEASPPALSADMNTANKAEAKRATDIKNAKTDIKNAKKGFTENELALIIKNIIDNKYPEKTKALADSYLERAEEAISPFSNKYKDILLQALQYIRVRTK